MRWTQADEDAFQSRYQAQKAAAREAYEARGCQPPRRSRVNGPPADWKSWCCTLDGVPVGHCTEFDVDEGWVQVYVVEPKRTGVIRVLNEPQRRLYGKVEAVECEKFFEMRKTMGEIAITADDHHGEPVPGTELRMDHDPQTS